MIKVPIMGVQLLSPKESAKMRQTPSSPILKTAVPCCPSFIRHLPSWEVFRETSHGSIQLSQAVSSRVGICVFKVVLGGKVTPG